MLRPYDSSGSPEIDLQVFATSESDHRTITAIVDTGFTGFLLLPISVALTLGLVPHATIDITLADGSTQSKLVCLGGIRFEDQSRTGIIIIEEQSTEALIGMEFLKSLGLTLTIDAVAGTLELEPSKR